MSKDNGKGSTGTTAGDEHFEQLMQAVGKRSEIPEGAREKAEHRFREELITVSARRTRTKRRVQFAIAATVVLSSIVLLNLSREPYQEPMVVAVIAESIGEGYWQNNGTKRALTVGTRLSVGDVFSTSTGYVRLSLLENSVDLRISRDSKFRFDGTESIFLEQGSVYIDATLGSANRFLVNTQFGIVEHIGTQYMVTSKPNKISIAVREGEVRFEGEAGIITGHASANEAELINITRSGLDSRQAISTSDERWRWVNKITPEFSTDGKSLMVILDWAARESGRQIRASNEVRQLAEADYSLRGAKYLSTQNLDRFIRNAAVYSDGFVITALDADIIELARSPSEPPD